MRVLSCAFVSCAFLISAAVAAADDQSSKPPVQPPAKAAKKPVVITVPADAVQVSPGLYRAKDKDGKVWMYRRTPFGVQRWQEDGEDAKKDAVVEQTNVVDLGDSVRFERTSPFGKRTWVRKKTELDETEQRIWSAEQAKNAGAPKTEKQ
jgi:hypothetical protein